MPRRRSEAGSRLPLPPGAGLTAGIGRPCRRHDTPWHVGSLGLLLPSSALLAGVPYGTAVEDVEEGAEFVPGDAVRVVFQSACPRNSLGRPTFLTVERQDPSTGAWAIVATDDEWETRFQWGRCVRGCGRGGVLVWRACAPAATNPPSRLVRCRRRTNPHFATHAATRRQHTFSTESFATITWIIPAGTESGVYRLGHQGDYRHILGTTHAFSGYSAVFTVAAERSRLSGLLGLWRGACRVCAEWIRAVF